MELETETRTETATDGPAAPAGLTERQKLSILNYRRYGGIDIELLEGGIVRIAQNRLNSGILLNQKELHERAREVFPDKRYRIKPVVYSLRLDEVDEDWIRARMEEYGIKRNDLIKQLGMDKSYLSLLLAEPSNKRKIGLTRATKATFFYYFKTYELGRDLLEYATHVRQASVVEGGGRLAEAG